MSSRKAATPRVSALRARTPYDRPVARTPTSPRFFNSPGGIFSKVKDFLSPSKRLFGQDTDGYRENDAEEYEEESFDDEMETTPVNIFSYPPPSSGRSPLPSGLSPNERLVEFFKAKGDNPLSEMEVEGVLSLIKQAGGPESLPEPSEREDSEMSFMDDSPLVRSGAADRSDTQADSATVPTRLFNTPLRMSSRSSDGSPAAYTPLYTPGSAAKHAPVNSTRPKRVSWSPLHYGEIPTPYRPSRSRVSSPMSVSSRESTPDITTPVKRVRVESDAVTVSDSSKEAKEDKPLSQTASALLSILGPSETDNKDNAGSQALREVEEYVNPYAAKSHRATPRRSRPSTPSSSPAASPMAGKSAVEALEVTRPKSKEESVSTSSPTVTSTVNKYKPAKSSSLRESVVLSPEQPQKSPLGLFKFSPATSSFGDKQPSMFSPMEHTSGKQELLSPSKPLSHPSRAPATSAVPAEKRAAAPFLTNTAPRFSPKPVEPAKDVSVSTPVFPAAAPATATPPTTAAVPTPAAASTSVTAPTPSLAAFSTAPAEIPPKAATPAYSIPTFTFPDVAPSVDVVQPTEATELVRLKSLFSF